MKRRLAFVLTIGAVLAASTERTTAPADAAAIGAVGRDMVMAFTEGRVSADGRRVVVTGNAACTVAAEDLTVTVSLMQPAQLASARGSSAGNPCVPGPNEFAATLAVPVDRPSFTPGPVEACALAQSRIPLGNIDMWCGFVFLEADPSL